MHTLLLRLVAPMQSWGVESRFTVRDTGREPSKSGVIGLLCAALGRPRSEPLHDLSALRMGVRVDREGRLRMDFHTAKEVFVAKGGKPKETEVSRRYYLADAAFLVGLESADFSLLCQLHAALRDPVWTLYLGRKAFVPGAPVWLEDGLQANRPLMQSLGAYPYLGSGSPPEKVRLVYEHPQGEIVRSDAPISFAERRFAPRRIRVQIVPWGSIPEVA